MKLNIPYFRQEKNTTCGVACLRMVMAFYSKDIKEFELEETCETGWLGGCPRMRNSILVIQYIVVYYKANPNMMWSKSLNSYSRTGS